MAHADRGGGAVQPLAGRRSHRLLGVRLGLPGAAGHRARRQCGRTAGDQRPAHQPLIATAAVAFTLADPAAHPYAVTFTLTLPFTYAFTFPFTQPISCALPRACSCCGDRDRLL